MSTHDKEALQILQDTCRQNGERYEIVLPWKRDTPLPNNCFAALSPQPRKTLLRTPTEESQIRRNLAEGFRKRLRETSQNATSDAPANLVPPHASRRESQ